MQLTLVVPGLLDLPAHALASIDAEAPALSRIIASSRDGRIEADGLLAAACRACGIERQQDWPVAPRLARAGGLEPAGAYWLCAQPVTLVAGAHDVRLSGVVRDLSPADGEALVAALNAHFSDDEVEFMTAKGARWFIRAREAQKLSTRPPEAALGAPLFSFLPRGDDGARWRRWLNEAQMILFEHPVNDGRQRAAMPPANSVWIWGGGADAPPTRRSARIFGNDSTLSELARGSGIAISSLATGFDALAGSHSAVAWLDPISEADGVRALADLDRAWTAPAQRSLDAGGLSLEVVVGGRAQAFRLQARRSALGERLRARFSPPRGSEILLGSREPAAV